MAFSVQAARLVAIALLLASMAAAQRDRRGWVAGTMVDPSQSPVPATLVMLEGPGERRSVRTGPAGEFRFDALAPGDYHVRVAVPGFEPIEREVRVGEGRTARLTLQLKLATLRQELTIGENQAGVTPDAAREAGAVSVERTLLDQLPVLDLDYVATLTRFLGSLPGGGEPSLVVDGMESRNVGVTPSAIQEVRINQNPYTAEYPRWSRRRIEVITKTGTDAYHGTFNFLLRDHRLNAREAFALVRPPEQRRIWEGSLFGPLGTGQNTSFLFSGLREDEDLYAVVNAVSPAGPVRANLAAPQHNTFFSLRAGHQFSERTAAFWQVNFQDRWQNNVGAGATVLEEAASQTRFREDEFIFNHRRIISSRLVSQFRILLGRYWAPARSNLDAPRVVVSDAFTGGGAQADALRTEVHTSITWLLTQTRGRHTLKYGFNVPDWSRRGFSDRAATKGIFQFASLDDYRDGRPYAAVVQRGDPRAVFTEKNLGGFVQDEWRPGARVSIAAGLRYDWQNFFGDTNNVSPRIAAAWAPGRTKGLMFRAGAGYFYERSGPAPIWDILRYDGRRLLRYVIADPVFPPAGPVQEALPSSVTRLESGAELPRTLQFSAGLEKQVARKTVLAVSYIGTRGAYLFRSRDANAPLPPIFFARPDPGVGALRMIEAAGRMTGNAIEITVRGDLGPKFNGLVQYTSGRTWTDTGGLNWYPADSFRPAGEWGRADTDRRHQFNVLASGNLHRWLNLGLAVSLLSGAPFNITTGRDENRDGIALDRPAGVARNTGQGPDFVGIDLRWFREFRLRPAAKERSPSATVSFDAFNVINRVNYQNYLGALTSPFFGKAVAAQPPRRVQLGFRLQF